MLSINFSIISSDILFISIYYSKKAFLKEATIMPFWTALVAGRSHRRSSLWKDVLGNFPKFTWKQLCQSLFLNKVAVLSMQLYLKRDSAKGVFLWILRNFLEQTIYKTTLRDSFCMAPVLSLLPRVILTNSW